MDDNLPPGFRFHPTDEELITCYLTRKATDVSFTSKVIADVDLNKCEPWDLPAKASMGEKEWYFFSMRDRKYPTGLRTNRATEAGYWKTTGKDKEIFRASQLVGMKKTLVFYRGRAPRGEKSNWVMHEYRLESNSALRTIKDEWVVCRVFQKSSSMKIVKPEEQSMDSPCDTSSAPSEFTDIDFPSTNFIDSNHYINNSVSPHQPSSSIDNNNSLLSYLNENNLTWEATRGLAAAAAPPPPLPWPSSFLSSTNLAMNSLILKVLQLKSVAALNSSEYGHHHQHPLLQPQVAMPSAHQFGGGTGMGAGLNVPSSSSKQQQGGDQPQQEQSMNWAPFNEGI